MKGKQKQQKRTNTFFEFINASSGILLCTDVAARGLDIPKVDWIVQFDPPDDPRDYIHRVGRTARAGKTGKSLLFLLESELGFLRYLKEAKVPLNEYTFPTDKIANVQSQVRGDFIVLFSSVLLMFCLPAREVTSEELFPTSVRTGWVSILSPSIRFPFAEKDL